MPIRTGTGVISGAQVDTLQASPTSMTIHTAGATFQPVLVLSDQNAVVTWTLPGGTISHATTLAVNWGTAAARTTALLVEPWSAVQRMNFGYAAADGGDPDIERVTACDITAIEGLELVKDTLGQLCLCNCEHITRLDLHDFIALDTLECYGCLALKRVPWRNMWNLQRICFEMCVLEELDLACCPALEDLRAGANLFNGINFGATGKATWHICVRNSDHMHADYPDWRQFPLLQELFIWDNNLRGVLNFNTGHISALVTVLAADNQFTSADFTDRFKGVGGPGAIDLSSNELTAITLTGCTHIHYLLAPNNHLNEAAIDGILAVLSGNAVNNGTLALTGNAPPSLVGLTAVATLRGRGWTVAHDARTPILESIAVTPDVTTVAQDRTRQMTATGTYDDASTANITTTVTWTSSDETHATIGAHTGLITGVAVSDEDEVTITATLGEVSDDTTLTVSEPPALESIAVTPAAASLEVGATQQYVATGTYADASTDDVTAEVTWDSSDDTHATISVGGLATGVAESTAGEVEISAAIEAIEGTTTLTVTPTTVDVTFTSEGAAVNMSCVVTGSPTITWAYSGGATASGANPAAYSWGTSAHRTSTLTISNPTMLTEFGIHAENPMGVSSISGLSDFPNLTTICDISDTALTTVDVAGCAALTTIHLAGTGLTADAADQLCIDLDAAVGSGSGEIYIPNVVTSASAAARSSLAGKGWNIQLG